MDGPKTKGATGTITFTPDTGGNICVRPSPDTRFNWTFWRDDKPRASCTIRFAPGQSQTYTYEVLKDNQPLEIEILSVQQIGQFDYTISLDDPAGACATPAAEANTVEVIICVRDGDGNGLVREVVFNELAQTTNPDGEAAGCTVFRGLDDDAIKRFSVLPPSE